MDFLSTGFEKKKLLVQKILFATKKNQKNKINVILVLLNILKLFI